MLGRWLLKEPTYNLNISFIYFYDRTGNERDWVFSFFITWINALIE